jgi:ribosomal protein S12 methylthiotransferase accessory factor
LAFGTDRDDATERALLECIERDGLSWALCSLARGRAPRRRLDPSRLGSSVAALAERLGAAGLGLALRDVTGEVRVPTVLATIWESFAEGRWTHQGVAARARSTDAAVAALLEAIQARAVDIQGAREDLRNEPLASADAWYYADGEAYVEPTGDAAEGSGALLERLAAARVPAPCRVDLSPPAAPGSVVRIVAPALECCALDPTRMGPRARAWLGQ